MLVFAGTLVAAELGTVLEWGPLTATPTLFGSDETAILPTTCHHYSATHQKPAHHVICAKSTPNSKLNETFHEIDWTLADIVKFTGSTP